MSPEQITAVLLASIFIFGCNLFWRSWLSHKKNADENKNEIIKKEIENKTIEKMSQMHYEVVKLIKDTEKEILSDLSNIDNKLEYQDEEYTREDFIKIRKEKYPNKKAEPKSKTLKGEYVVAQISTIEPHFIIIKNNDGNQIKVSYGEDLLSEMQDFKSRFKQAIENEGKIFYIEAKYFEKNGKGDHYNLYRIDEQLKGDRQ